ncbi:ubiquitin protein atg12 [Echinococcus multilocularis]|uniref:Ubiquitin-like protein ATG12 n=1 Tax=Echinococcus multilocularis TaxID=6211 RepID=H9M5Q9_ECHMU|nr:ATG12 protein [Echinococcus multilocularis]CDI98729.1 ubiquitin protein atg12 [Echinococcus multilocularis]
MTEAAVDATLSKEVIQGPFKEQTKIEVLFKPVGDAPCMKKSKWKVARSDTLSAVTSFLFKYLNLIPQQDSIFIFVSSSFTPPLDTELGTLFDCFSTEGTLILQYCKSQAWG